MNSGRNRSLLAPESYTAQIEKLRAKVRKGRKEPATLGVTLAAISGSAPSLARVLAKAVARGQHEFLPLREVSAFIDGKRRTLYLPDLADAIVLGAVSYRLMELMQPCLSDAVYSYRPGRSAPKALSAFTQYLHAHAQAFSDKKTRGLYVVQRDISNYGESIASGSSSHLWTLLKPVLLGAPPKERQILQGLLEQACRPWIERADGSQFQMQRGLPTGSPIQQPLANLYLSELDSALEALSSAHYARFGDDLLVTTPSLDEAELAISNIEAHCSRLGLAQNPAKSKDYYFTGPGRPAPNAARIRFRGTSTIEYLGARISFDGRLGLKRSRQRELLQRIRKRAQNLKRLKGDEGALQVLAEGLHFAVSPEHPLSDPALDALTSWVDDRAQLRQLDHLLLRCVAESLSENRSVRCFRKYPPHRIRKAGLPSLLQLRRRTAR